MWKHDGSIPVHMWWRLQTSWLGYKLCRCRWMCSGRPFHLIQFDPDWIQFDPIWSNLIHFDPMQSNEIQYDPIWSHLIPFDSIWYHLIPFDPVSSHLIPYDPIWSNLIQFDPIWSNLNQFLSYLNQIINLMQFEQLFIASFCDQTDIEGKCRQQQNMTRI